MSFINVIAAIFETGFSKFSARYIKCFRLQNQMNLDFYRGSEIDYFCKHVQNFESV